MKTRTALLLLLILVGTAALSQQSRQRLTPRPVSLKIYDAVTGKLLDRVYTSEPAWKVVAHFPPGRYRIVSRNKILWHEMVVL